MQDPAKKRQLIAIVITVLCLGAAVAIYMAMTSPKEDKAALSAAEQRALEIQASQKQDAPPPPEIERPATKGAVTPK